MLLECIQETFACVCRKSIMGKGFRSLPGFYLQNCTVQG